MTKSRKVSRPAPVAAPRSPFASLSPLTQDILSAVFLYVVTLVLFRAIVFNNAAFATGGDTAAALSYSHAGNMLQQQEGVDVLWMPFFFSGMPTFGNVAFIPRSVNYVQEFIFRNLNIFYLNGDWTWYCVYYFLGGLFMFLLLRTWRLPRVAALLAALTFMLSPYAIGLAPDGHGSKLMAVSYIPLVFLLTHMLFERRDPLSLGLLSIAIGTQLLTNHMQIVYYSFMVVGFYLLYHIILDARSNFPRAAWKTALFAGALVIGLCISAYIYMSVYEYAQYSMRGGGTTGATGGLAYDYATNWSWSPGELITLLIPSFYGLQMPFYWGFVEPWTNSTVYVGIIPVFLSIIALIYKRNRLTLFIAILTLVVVLISFGRNFSLLYEILFAVLPFFNKFRAPAMILHLLPFTLGILAAYGYAALTEEAENRKPTVNAAKIKKALLVTSLAAAGLLLLVLALKGTLQEWLSSFTLLRTGEVEQIRQQYGAQANQALAYLKQNRFDLLWKDSVKFLLLTMAAGGVAYALFAGKIRTWLFGAALIAILLIDLFIIDGKYITPHPANAVEQNFRPDATVSYLKQQPGLFRVFPLGQDLFMDNTFAYHGLHSIGGYSPAKLKIYQTMLDSCMYKGADPSFPLNMNIVNMLNVQYLVAQGRLPEDRFELANADRAKQTLTYRNPTALPRAFFVDTVMSVQSDHEVFSMLNDPSFDPARTAVVHGALPAPLTHPDSSRAEVTGYQSRRIAIRATTTQPALLVLSEVYYPAGWTATIDGTETEILRTNYVLRSVIVPAGTHEIVFSFDPPVYRAGWIISHVGWVIAFALILLGLWRVPAVRRLLKRQTRVPEEAPAPAS